MLKTKESNVDLYLKGELAYDLLNDVEEDEVEMIQLEQRRDGIQSKLDEIQSILDEGYVYSEEEEKKYKEEAKKYKEELAKIKYTLEHFYEGCEDYED